MTSKKSRTLIIEKGGYRPEVSGPALPPTMTRDGGYRPVSSGPSAPPTSQPAKGVDVSEVETKK